MYKETMHGVYNKYEVQDGNYKGRTLAVALTVLVILAVLSTLGN